MKKTIQQLESEQAREAAAKAAMVTAISRLEARLADARRLFESPDGFHPATVQERRAARIQALELVASETGKFEQARNVYVGYEPGP